MHIKSFQVDDPMLECLGYSSMQGLNEPSFKAQKNYVITVYEWQTYWRE